MPYVVILGDLFASKQISSRAAFQRLLADVMASVSAANPSISSPYTLTLGDEFQAVYARASGLMADLCRIRRACPAAPRALRRLPRRNHHGDQPAAGHRHRRTGLSRGPRSD